MCKKKKVGKKEMRSRNVSKRRGEIQSRFRKPAGGSKKKPNGSTQRRDLRGMEPTASVKRKRKPGLIQG